MCIRDSYSGVQPEYAVLRLPRQAARETPQSPRAVLPRGDGGPAVFFPRWDEAGTPQILGRGGGDATAFIEASPYARVYALARRSCRSVGRGV